VRRQYVFFKKTNKNHKKKQFNIIYQQDSQYSLCGGFMGSL